MNTLRNDTSAINSPQDLDIVARILGGLAEVMKAAKPLDEPGVPYAPRLQTLSVGDHNKPFSQLVGQVGGKLVHELEQLQFCADNAPANIMVLKSKRDAIVRTWRELLRLCSGIMHLAPQFVYERRDLAYQLIQLRPLVAQFLTFEPAVHRCFDRMDAHFRAALANVTLDEVTMPENPNPIQTTAESSPNSSTTAGCFVAAVRTPTKDPKPGSLGSPFRKFRGRGRGKG